jgi:hypothetical protein
MSLALTETFSQMATLPPCVWVGLASGDVAVWQADAGLCGYGDLSRCFRLLCGLHTVSVLSYDT